MTETKSKFVVAVDDSEVSANAFTWALANLVKPSDSVLVLTAKAYSLNDAVVTADIASAGEFAVPLVPALTPEDEAEIEESARALVDKYMRQCAQVQVESEGEVVSGDPGPRIIEEATRINADAIVVGSHGRGLLARTFIGSISDYVRHRAHIPVVIVQQPKIDSPQPAINAPGVPRNIVIAVDESPEAAFAFTWGVQHVVRDEDRMTVLHVQNVIAPPTALGVADQFGMEDVYIPPDTSSKANVDALNESEALVQEFMRRAQALTKATVEGRVVTGQTEDKLVQALVTAKADVAVVGTRDQDMMARAFLGSVTDYLAHHCPCPLVVAKMPKDSPAGAAATAGHAHAG